MSSSLMKLFACSTAAALSSMAVKAAPASSANQSTSSIPAPSITNQVTGPIDVFPILHAAVNPGKINWFTNGALPQHGGNSVASCQFSSGTSILWYDTVKASAPLNFNGQIPVYLIYFYNPSTTSTFLTTDATIINNFANNFGSSSMWTNVIQAYSYQSVSPGIPYLAKVVNQACSGTSTYSCASHDNIIYDSNGVISPSASSNTDIVITLIGAKKIPPHTQAVYAIIGGPGTSYTISETSGSINVVNMPIGGSTNTPTCSRKMYLLYYSGVACQGGGSKAFTCTTSSGESAPCCKLEVARIQYPTAGTLCASLLINPNAGITTTPNNNIALDHAIAFLAHEISEMAVAPIVGQNQMNLADYCGNELADKCQNVMLASYGSNYAYSMQLNGYNYGIFSVWDNVNMVCSKGDAPAPSIGSTVSGYCNVCTVGSSLFAGVGYNGISGQLTDTIYSNLMSTVSTTSNGGYSLVIEGDGGLVHYNQGNALWRSGSAGNPAGSYRAIMQTDGNLVVYDNSGNALWSTGTYGTGNGFNCAVVQTDSNFVVYDQDCNAQWWEW